MDGIAVSNEGALILLLLVVVVGGLVVVVVLLLLIYSSFLAQRSCTKKHSTSIRSQRLVVFFVSA